MLGVPFFPVTDKRNKKSAMFLKRGILPAVLFYTALKFAGTVKVSARKLFLCLGLIG